MTYFYPVPASTVRPWDDGIRWHLEQSADEGPNFELDPLQLPFVRDQHLRSPNGTLEDEYIEWLIRTSYRQAEKRTNRSLIPQTHRLFLSGLPWDAIEVPKGPLLTVSGIEDGNGDVLLAGSPAEFDVDAPSGPSAGRGSIRPLSGSAWPSSTDGAVVTFTAGYAVGADGYASIPEDITHGRLMMIAELYKQRSRSVQGVSNTAALIGRNLWADYRVY